MTTVLVAGAVANKHRHGGSVWVRMSWAEALMSLGFDVVFVEQIAAADCDEAAAAAFARAMRMFGLEGRASLLCDDGRVVGMPRAQLLERAADAALLVNISGHLRDHELLRRVRRRAYVDLDPGYTQIWGADAAGLAGHDAYFSVGLNVGTARCELPDAGVRWRPVRQPVVLERWAPRDDVEHDGFTTVASWRGAFGRVSWRGRTYGLKAHEFRRFAALPRLAGERFAIALDIHPADGADAARLQEHGWRLIDPAVVRDVAGFRDFVRGSGAEFSSAQGVYVESRSGWFSDRTVRYLAAGRPALVQDTGFSAHLPTGEGLIAFDTLAQARAGAAAIAADYDAHRRAARRIAEQHFAPAPALAPLLDAIGVAP